MERQKFAELFEKASPKVTYFTKEELSSFLEEITPKKGVHYFDGEKGKDGVDGKNGKDGRDGTNGRDGRNGLNGRDGKNGLNGIDGKDGLDGKGLDPKEYETIIEDLKKEIATLRTKVMANYGGHGGTLKAVTTTTSDSQTFTLTTPVSYAELWVIRAGAVQSDLDGDFTYTLQGDKVKTITLASALSAGENLRIKGK